MEQWFLLVVEQTASAVSDPPVETDDRPIWEIITDSMKDVSPEIVATLPKDGASQQDHYIYGWPKREE